MIQERAIYKLESGRDHCKHGIVYTIKSNDGVMWAIDTYWDSRFTKGLNSDGYCYIVDEIEDQMEFVMMLDDIKEVSREEFYLYDIEGTIHLPVGGWNERYLVNKNAKKNIERVCDSIRSKIISNDNMIKSLKRDNEKLIMWEKSVLMNENVAQLYKNEKYELDVVDAVEMYSRKKEEN
ncbi:hypothetical protein [Paenibacillus xylanexedens]|uniref:hypothetical protein n=1 Tax=Paenibacillus xylanexedens TaxID=528191 RepID=UPI0011A8A095|nr:hypothetical protein [Paenibacillus xylanexedens]